MTITKKRKLLITQLDEHLVLLHKSVVALDYSYDKEPAINNIAIICLICAYLTMILRYVNIG